MRATEFITEHKTSREEFEGMTIEMVKNGHVLVINALDDWGNNILGHVAFNIGDDNDLDPQELEVDERYQGQGIAKAMYDYAKSKGYTIHRSYDQTDAGKGFWDKHRGEDVRVWESVDADKVLQYVKQAHSPEQFNIDYSITDHPKWELKNIPLSQLNLDPNGEATDPYNRVNWVDYDKVQDLVPNISAVLKRMPVVVDSQGWIIDGNHRATAAAEAGLTSVPAYVPVAVNENFADGKHPEDKGDSKRYGVPTKASVSTLRKVAKQGGRKGQLAHWMANMKSGRAKAKHGK